MSGSLVPNQADFLAFIRTQVGIGTAFLPDNSPSLTNAFVSAMSFVATPLNLVSPFFYQMAVYNLGADFLINYAPDVAGQNYFESARRSFKISGFVPGVVASTGDSGTSTGLVSPSWATNLSMMDLQNLRTPWGRRYLEIAQQLGTAWGIS